MNTIFPSRYLAERYLVLAGNDLVLKFTGVDAPSGWLDVLPCEFSQEAESADKANRWSGGWLTGYLMLTNGYAVRTYAGGDTLTMLPAMYDTEEEKTWAQMRRSAAVMCPFRNYMMAADVTWDDENFSYRVQWCNPVEPGQPPTDWVTRDTNRAGDVDLADTVGKVIDMVPYKDVLLVYKEDAVYVCQWIGGNQVFSFSKLHGNVGITARDTVVEYQGVHWVQGFEDLYILDSSTARSILWGRAKNWWLKDRDPDRCFNNWTVLDRANEEILFGYVSRDAGAGVIYPNRALVFNVNAKSMFLRDYGKEIPFAVSTLNVMDQSSSDLALYAIDRGGNSLLELESGPDRDGQPVPSILQRQGLFASSAHDSVQVDRARVDISGAQATLTLGEHHAADAPVDWRSGFTVNPATDYKTDARANGIEVAYKLEVSADTAWKLSQLQFLVQKSGERDS